MDKSFVSSFLLTHGVYNYAYNMPTQLHYIQLYMLCYPRRCLWRLRRAVSPAALFSAAPTAADDDDFLDFSHDDIFFHQHFRSLIDDDYDNRALRDLSADSTMTSPLLCDKPTYLLR